MIKEGILYFHQGWTDIINCLSLINYYCNLYDKIYLIIRDDSKELVDFYIRSLNNVEVLYINKNILDNSNIIDYLHNNQNNILDNDYLFHGGHDYLRKDIYINKFINTNYSFVKAFFELYNISYITRINNFEFERNYELENSTYDKFIKIYSKNYILYHEITEYNNSKNITSINLNASSNIFFDMIKVLENAIEIHLLDSVWGAFIYLLDAKYGLFKNKNIYLYPKRGYISMFHEPVKLDNWIFL